MIKARKTDSRMSRKGSKPCGLGIECFLGKKDERSERVKRRTKVSARTKIFRERERESYARGQSVREVEGNLFR